MDGIVLIRSCENNRKYAPIVSIILFILLYYTHPQNTVGIVVFD